MQKQWIRENRTYQRKKKKAEEEVADAVAWMQDPRKEQKGNKGLMKNRETRRFLHMEKERKSEGEKKPLGSIESLVVC